MAGKSSTKQALPIASDGGYDLYERDFYSWTQTQAALLQSGRFDEADIANIAEEIETLGRSELGALRSAYRLILLHLLNMRFQSERSTRSWRLTIVRERGRVEDLLAENPGLVPKRSEAFMRAYKRARNEAAEETGIDLKNLPPVSPFRLEDVENPAFWPEA